VLPTDTPEALHFGLLGWIICQMLLLENARDPATPTPQSEKIFLGKRYFRTENFEYLNEILFEKSVQIE